MFLPNPIAFTVFGWPIAWYGILIAAAVVIGILIARGEAKRKGHDPEMILDLALLATPLAIIGGRLYYVAFEWENYVGNPISILYIWQGGMAIYGAIIGGVIAALIFSKWKKIALWEILDMVAPSLVLGQAIGRWGNFFNQEAHGIPILDSKWQFFPFAVYIEYYVKNVYGPWRAATFFYESIACFAIFAFLMWYRRRSKRNGNVFLGYTLLYGIARAFIEGLRTDSLYIGSLRVSQVLSIALVIFAAAMLFIRHFSSWRLEDEVDERLIVMKSGPQDDEQDEMPPLEEAGDLSASFEEEPGSEQDFDREGEALQEDAPAQNGQDEAALDNKVQDSEDEGQDEG